MQYSQEYLKNSPTTEVTPSLVCSRDMDKFTVDRVNGNGDLDYPIGLLTTDEINLAGHPFSYHKVTYLTLNSDRYWKMSPLSFRSGCYMHYMSGASLNSERNNTSAGVRPAISLKNTATISGGNGEFSTPYIINS